MTDRFILMLAPVGRKRRFSPSEVVEEAVRCRVKGVSIVHFRATRNDQRVIYDIEPYSQMITWIRERSDLLVEFPTWGTLGHSVEDRISTLVLNPDFVEVIPGSLNIDSDVIYNPRDYISFLLQTVAETSATVVFKVFSPSMIFYARKLIEEENLKPPYIFTLTFSNRLFPATPENLIYMVKSLPSDSMWFVSAFGKIPRSLWAMALDSGGNIRIGLEDLEEGGDSSIGNEQLLDKLLSLSSSLGVEPATPKEVKDMLRRETGK